MSPRQVAQLLAALALSVAARADVVALTGRPPFRDVTVLDYRDGILTFRGVSQQVLRKRITELAWLEIPDQPALAHAESLARAGDWSSAAAAYRRVDEDAPVWVRGLAQVRLMRALDEAGDFGEAVKVYVALRTSGQKLPASIHPYHPSPPGSEDNTQALETLRSGLQRLERDARRDVETLTFELSLLDSIPLEPIEVATQAAAPTDPLAEGKDAPLGLLPPDLPEPQPPRRGGSEVIGLFPASQSASREAAARAIFRPGTPVTLGADALVLSVARERLAQRHAASALLLVEKALPYVAADDRAPYTLLQGRCLIEVGRAPEAVSHLMALATRQSAPSESAFALYYAAVAHERLRQPEIAIGLYQELADDSALPAELAEPVQAGLARCRPPASSKDRK